MSMFVKDERKETYSLKERFGSFSFFNLWSNPRVSGSSKWDVTIFVMRSCKRLTLYMEKSTFDRIEIILWTCNFQKDFDCAASTMFSERYSSYVSICSLLFSPSSPKISSLTVDSKISNLMPLFNWMSLLLRDFYGKCPSLTVPWGKSLSCQSIEFLRNLIYKISL